jgi:hypothetical protein
MDLAALWISFIAAAAGLGSAVIAWTARADSLKSGERAQRSADRATLAAERVAVIQAQVFDGPPWEVMYWSGDTFLLTNTSPIAAQRVTVSSEPDDLDVRLDRDMPFDVGARSAVKFMYSVTMADPWERDLVVTWTRDGDEAERRWTHPIPPKPRS